MKNKFLSVPMIELLAKGLAFITIILMTHILSVTEMGFYSVIVTLVMIASVFMDGGINNKLYSLILQRQEKKLSDFYTLKIIFSFLSIIAVGVYSYFFYIFWIDIVIYMLMTFFVSQIIMYKFVYRAKQITYWDALTIIIDPVVKLSILILIYTLHLPVNLNYLLFVFLIASIFEYILIYINFKRHFAFFHLASIGLKKFINTFSQLKHYVLYYFLYIVYQRVDIFYIESYINAKEAAVYFSAYNIYTAVIIFITALVSVALPKIKEMSFKNKLKYFSNYYILYLILLPLSYLVIPKVYQLIYPQAYQAGAYTLFLLLFAVPFVFVSYLSIMSLNFLNLESKNILPVSFILIFKLAVFISMENYFANIDIFAKSYIVFEMILAFIFIWVVLVFEKNSKGNEKNG